MQPAACESPQELLMRASEFLCINQDRHGAGDSLVAASGIDHNRQIPFFKSSLVSVISSSDTWLITCRSSSAFPATAPRIDRPDEAENRDIIDFRTKLECTFLRSCHRMITNEKIRQLRRICDEYSAVEKKDFITLWQTNTEFHCELFAAYKNDYALHVLKEAMSRQLLNYVEAAQEAVPEADLHYAVLDYLEKGNIQTAATLLEADIGKIETPG